MMTGQGAADDGVEGRVPSTEVEPEGGARLVAESIYGGTETNGDKGLAWGAILLESDAGDV